jgi:tetratricopeptide (TPR) repeat protein
MKTILLLIVFASLSLGRAANCQEVAQTEPSSKSLTDDQAEIRDLLGKLKANPKSSSLHNQLAVLYGTTGNLDGFEKEINTAIELEPKDPINYFQASLVYGRNGQGKRQILMLEKAIALDSHNPVFRFERARIYEVKGIRNRAKQNYLRARQLLVVGIQKGKEFESDRVLRNSRVVEGTYYDSFNNAYSVENLAAGIEKGLLRISD